MGGLSQQASLRSGHTEGWGKQGLLGDLIFFRRLILSYRKNLVDITEVTNRTLHARSRPPYDTARHFPPPTTVTAIEISSIPLEPFASITQYGSHTRPLPLGYPQRLWRRICHGCTSLPRKIPHVSVHKRLKHMLMNIPQAIGGTVWHGIKGTN